MVLDEVEQLLHAERRELGLGRDLVDGRVAIQLLAERASGPLHAADLICDVNGEPDRAALLGERPLHRLADPPRRIGGQLVPHRPVELLDGAHEAEVALLDEVQQRHVGTCVVARDRHDEPEVRLDQLPLGEHIPLVLPPCELSLLDRSQQPPVADRPNVELQRIVNGLTCIEVVRPLARRIEERLRSIRLHERRIG